MGSARTIALLAGSAVLLGYFIVHERFLARSPLLPMSLWRTRAVSGANVVSVLLSSAVFAMFYSTTLYMQLVLHYSALRTGLCYLPFGLSILVAAGGAAELVRLAGVRIASAAGAVLAAAGLIWFSRIPVGGHLLTAIVIPSIITGLGAGLLFMTTTVAAMSGVPAARSGVASALLNVSRQLGGALGFAVIVTVITGVSARSSGVAPVVLTSGFHAGFRISAVLLAGALLAALVLLREDGRGQRINPVELQAV